MGRENSLRLKIIGWLYILYGVMSVLAVCQAVAVFMTIGGGVQPRLPPMTLLFFLILGLAYGSASAYAGLMLLDRSRMAGYLLLILSASWLSSTFVQRPFSALALAVALIGLALTLSIWNELEGPLPFGLTNRGALASLLLVFTLGLLRPQRSTSLRPVQRPSPIYRTRTTVIRGDRVDVFIKP